MKSFTMFGERMSQYLPLSQVNSSLKQKLKNAKDKISEFEHDADATDRAFKKVVLKL